MSSAIGNALALCLQGQEEPGGRALWHDPAPVPSPDRLNRESVQCIQRSLFTVCLDASVLKVSDERFPARVAAQMLHGGGSWSNSGNRWFDKALQVRWGQWGWDFLLSGGKTSCLGRRDFLSRMTERWDFLFWRPGLPVLDYGKVGLPALGTGTSCLQMKEGGASYLVRAEASYLGLWKAGTSSTRDKGDFLLWEWVGRRDFLFCRKWKNCFVPSSLPSPFSCPQFIVGEDGVCGVVYEQAVVDAQPVATIVDHALEYWYGHFLLGGK